MMTEREKVIAGLEAHANMETACATAKKEECPYYGYHEKDKMCSEKLAEDALALIKTLSEDVEVWKRRYKWKCVRRTNDPEPYENPNIVKIYTSEEMEKTDHEK